MARVPLAVSTSHETFYIYLTRTRPLSRVATEVRQDTFKAYQETFEARQTTLASF